MTSHKNQDARAAESVESVAEQVVSLVTAGLHVVDMDGRFVWVNPEFARMFGYRDPSVLEGMDTVLLVHPDDRGRIRELQKARGDGGLEAYATRFKALRADGSTFYMELRGRLTQVDGNPVAIGMCVDVTERRALERELDAKEDLLARASRVAKVGGWQFTVPDMKGSWTEEIARLLEIDETDDTPVDYGLSFYSDSSRQLLSDAITRAVEHGTPYDLELDLTTARGAHKWVHTVGEPVLQDGRVVRVDGITQDVTQAHRQREERDRILERYRTLMEQSPDGIFVTDPQGIITEVNEAGAAMFGHSPAELVGTLGRALVDPRRGTVELDRNESLPHGVTRTDWYFVRADGTSFVGEVLSRKLPDGSVQMVVRDVTATREAAEQLRYRAVLLETEQNASPSGILVVDAQDHIVSYNKRFLDIWKVPPEIAAAGEDTPLLEYNAARVVDRDSFMARVRYLYDHRLETSKDEITLDDGTIIERYSAPVLGPDGHYFGRIWDFRDVTEMKGLERKIRALNADLERRVAARTAEVTAANAELEAFAYAVSHDLRAPLRAMSGFCAALEEDYGSQLDETAHAYTRHITEASKKMGDLIDAILTLSRTTRGGLRPERLDVSAMARTACMTVQAQDPERSVRWDVDDGLFITADRAMFEAALINLIDNAWKYTSHTEDPVVRVYARQDMARTWLCVDDNGAGFDGAYADKLFIPFARLHRDDEYPGIGIGLATVQRIVSRHGGLIRATGSPGKGARLRLWIPEDGGL